MNKIMDNSYLTFLCLVLIILDRNLVKAHLEHITEYYGDGLVVPYTNDNVEGSCYVINLTAVSESPTSIFVDWEPPDSGCANFDSLSNYEVEWYGSSITGNPSGFTLNTNFTITGLYPCERYYITVTPCFQGIPSTNDSLSVYETTMTTAPNAPGMLGCITMSSSEIEVTWAESNSTNDLCGGNMFYNLFMEGHSLWDEFTESSSLNTTYTSVILSDLYPYTSYTIFVSANNDGGTSENVTCEDIVTLEEVKVEFNFSLMP